MDVTILYLPGGGELGGRGLAPWIEAYAARGITVTPLQPPAVYVSGSYAVRISHAAFTYLQAHAHAHDVVYFHEWLGSAYYTTMAKRLGLAFSHTTIVVGTHSPTMWAIEYSNTFPRSIGGV